MHRLIFRLQTRHLNMSNQATILSFFSPQQKSTQDKRTATGPKNCDSSPSADANVNIKPSLKRNHSPTRKDKENRNIHESDDELREGKETINIQLSPEQKQRMEENRQKALAKLEPKPTGLLINIGDTWSTALQDEFAKPYFEQLSKFVISERNRGIIYPSLENVFSWTQACSVSEVKVVILGQDPYHGPNQAHGLAFSVLPGVSPPPSLLNMYKELESDIEDFERPKHGYLMGWANQGVLMLNAVLTVRSHQANSHKDKGWERLTDATISYLNKHREGIVFMLWGSYAQKKGAHIVKSKHHVLKSVHPSPLSAHRGFMGCKHFSKCNSFLEEDGKTPINWSHLPDN